MVMVMVCVLFGLFCCARLAQFVCVGVFWGGCRTVSRAHDQRAARGDGSGKVGAAREGGADAAQVSRGGFYYSGYCAFEHISSPVWATPMLLSNCLQDSSKKFAPCAFFSGHEKACFRSERMLQFARRHGHRKEVSKVNKRTPRTLWILVRWLIEIFLLLLD